MQEIWKDIEGYEGLYQVSNLGNVKSLDRFVPHKKLGKKFCAGVMMSTHINNPGYVTVNLCKDNRCKSHDVHRLVAMAFVDGFKDGLEVNHIDENKQNNQANNLEWVTKSQNNRHGTKVERQSAKVKKAILQYDLQGNFLQEWNSATDAEKSLSGKFTGAISHCICGNTKTAYGYVWKAKSA